MPEAPISFGNDQKSGDHSLTGASPLAVNVVMDGGGAVRRRPGISAWSGYPSTIAEASQVDGIAAFDGDIYYVTANRKIFKVEAGVATNLSIAGADSFLAGSGRPVFAETQFRLAIAGGTKISKVDASAAAAALLGGSPPNATQVVALSSRVVCDDNTSSTTVGRIRYSETGSAGNETFDALRFVTAEARPDDIVALRENSNELFAFGATTLQVFSPDPIVVFAPGRAKNRGCSAAHSVIRVDESFAWFTDAREFIVSDGRSDEITSDAIAATLDDLTTISDCFGFRWNADQFDCLCWKFPTDGRTFVNQSNSGWAQWHGYTASQGHTAFPVTAHYYWPDENRHLVGLATGQVAELDSTATTDLGAPIQAEVQTGFINRDTDAVKTCEAVHFTFRRGHATGATPPVVLLSWRDGLGDFLPPIPLSLGVTGDNLFTVTKRSLGTYRARQWRLTFTDAVDFVLARATEVFSVGGSN